MKVDLDRELRVRKITLREYDGRAYETPLRELDEGRELLLGWILHRRRPT